MEDINEFELVYNGEDNNIEIQAFIQINNQSNIESLFGDDSETRLLVSSVVDQEKRFQLQLYVVIFILFLFIVFWVCGAVVVAEFFKFIIFMQELIFSYFYGVICVIFGIFMLCYFCLFRKDLCFSWKRFFLCEKYLLYDMFYEVINYSVLSNGYVIQVNGNLDLVVKSYNIT